MLNDSTLSLRLNLLRFRDQSFENVLQILQLILRLPFVKGLIAGFVM